MMISSIVSKLPRRDYVKRSQVQLFVYKFAPLNHKTLWIGSPIYRNTALHESFSPTKDSQNPLNVIDALIDGMGILARRSGHEKI